MLIKYPNILLLLCLSVAIHSCNNKKIKNLQKTSFVGTTMGSNINVTFYAAEKIEDMRDSVFAFLTSFNNEISTYDSTSWLSKYNKRKKGVINLSDTKYFKQLFSESFGAYLFSVGAFDPGMQPLFKLWNGMEENGIPSENEVLKTMKYATIRMFELNGDSLQKKHSKAQLQFNAVAPGFAADWIGKILERNGIDNYLVDVGGEFVASGFKPDGGKWTIAIDKPQKDRKPYMYLKVTDVAFATSGNYRKFKTINGKKYGHTIDPKTGKSALTDILSVTVFAEKSSVADATATACMTMGSEKAFEFAKNFRALFITEENGQLKLTKMNMDDVELELAD